MGYKTKVDWCDATWNPVTGCLHGCEYCYARKIAERFEGAVIAVANEEGYAEYSGTTCADGTLHDLLEPIVDYGKTGKAAPYPFGFDPTFHRYKLDEPQKWKKPRNIFVCSMADLFGDWVPDEWIAEVFRACGAAPQHRYLFLTKNPARYRQIADLIPDWEDTYINHSRPEMLFGATATDDVTMSKAYKSDAEWISVEPILQPIEPGWFATYESDYYGDMYSCRRWEWVVIGAETGNSKSKIVPQKEWVQEIADVCKLYGTPVFMKESLRTIMGDDFRQEFPWEV